MMDQIARVIGSAMFRKISRRRGQREPLLPGANGHRHHILLQPLIIANSGVAAVTKDILHAALSHDFQPDIRIAPQKFRHQPGQYQPGGTDRNIQPQRAAWRVAIAINRIQRGINFIHGGQQTFHQRPARFSQYYRACRPVKQSDTQLLFCPPHRIAQA